MYWNISGADEISKNNLLYRYAPISVIIFRKPKSKVFLPKGYKIDRPKDAFLFFDDNIIDNIVKYSNIEGKNLKPTNGLEIKAFIGLLLTAGVNSQNNIDYSEF